MGSASGTLERQRKFPLSTQQGLQAILVIHFSEESKTKLNNEVTPREINFTLQQESEVTFMLIHPSDINYLFTLKKTKISYRFIKLQSG